MSLTTDPKDPRLCHGHDDEPGPQCEVYLVLSEEERTKGFVRPVRDAYVHIGRDLSHYKGIHRMLTEEEQKENPKYVAVMTVLENEDGTFKGGSYVTQEELEVCQFGKRIGGCNFPTRMSLALAETYARNPSFYGSTYCSFCRKHLPVSEFRWLGTDITVGD